MNLHVICKIHDQKSICVIFLGHLDMLLKLVLVHGRDALFRYQVIEAFSNFPQHLVFRRICHLVMNLNSQVLGKGCTLLNICFKTRFSRIDVLRDK